MRKNFFKVLLILLLALTACRKSERNSSAPDSSPGGLDIFSSDQTDDAGKIIADANTDLKQIKAIYRDNEGSVKDLEDAMNAHDADKVKKISADLVTQINKGLGLGETAIQKIDDAEQLKINDTYRSYLDLKKDTLRKQLDAFEYRRQSAVLLGEGFGGKDKEAIEKAKAALKEREDNFKRLMEAARLMSEEANQIAKDSAKK